MSREAANYQGFKRTALGLLSRFLGYRESHDPVSMAQLTEKGDPERKRTRQGQVLKIAELPYMYGTWKAQDGRDKWMRVG